MPIKGGDRTFEVVDDVILREVPLVIDDFFCFEPHRANSSMLLAADHGFFGTLCRYDDQPCIDTIKRICRAICVIFFNGKIISITR